MDDTTEPALPEVDDVPEMDELEDGATEGEEYDKPDGEPEEAPDDTIEIEKDGAKLRIPAALKDEFMLRADYTRKTQEVAEQRKALEAQITEASAASDEELNLKAGLVAVNAAIQQYQGVDWDTLEQQDPAFAQRHFRTFMQLQSQKDELAQELTGASQKRTETAQRVIAERVAQRVAEVQEAIPDWGPAKATELMDFGAKTLGLSREYMSKITGAGEHDVVLVKLLNALHAASKSSPTKPRPVAEPKPATVVRGGSSPKKGLDDRMSAEDWVKQRNAQVAKR